MANKVGALIREARTGAGLTQEQLARRIKGISADDISKAERGEKELTQAVLKEVAKVTGVTQKSLIDAARNTSTAKKSASGKTSSSGKTAAKKTAVKKTTAKKTASAKTSSASAFKVSAQEKKLITAYREADEKVKTAVNLALLGTDSLTTSSGANDVFSTLLNGLKEMLGG